LEEALDMSSDRMLNECILYYQLRREVTSLPNRKLPPYNSTYRKKQKCWVTQRFMLYGFFCTFFAQSSYKYRVIVWSVRLMLSLRLLKGWKLHLELEVFEHESYQGMQFSFVSFQYNFLLYLNVLSFLNRQPVEQRN
jgi:hypothetical protein